MNPAYELRKIRLSELREFIQSKEYRHLKNTPISPNRASSYLHNPHAKTEDVSLYLLFHKGELIAYRSLYRDQFYQEERAISFGWLSGNWVHKDYRRQGISTFLFQEALQDWHFKVMFTNYAPESEKAYLETGTFSTLQTLKGKRFYIQNNWSEILAPKHPFFKKNKNAISKIDTLFNTFSRPIFIKKTALPSQVKIYDFDAFNPFHSIDNSHSFFRKNCKDYKWWTTYPWIEKTDNPSEAQRKYHFSSYSASYTRKVIAIYDTKGNLSSCFFLRIRDGHAKIPYDFCKEIDLLTIRKVLRYVFYTYPITHITLYSDTMIRAMGNRYLSKKFTQNFYISKDLNQQIDAPIAKIFTGDGDGIFT